MAMTGDDFRALSLSLEGTEERAHMGHPDFRVPAVVRGALVLAWELASAAPPASPRAARRASRT